MKLEVGDKVRSICSCNSCKWTGIDKGTGVVVRFGEEDRVYVQFDGVEEEGPILMRLRLLEKP